MNYKQMNHPRTLILSGFIFFAFAIQNNYKINTIDVNNSWVSVIAKAPDWFQSKLQNYISPNISLNDEFDPLSLPDDQYEELINKRGLLIKKFLYDTYKISNDESHLIIKSVFYWSKQHNLSPDLILSIIDKESGFNKKAVSSAGAIGLMQVIPQWHLSKIKESGGTKESLKELDFNINIGTKVLKEYILLSRGNLREALLRYNGSLQNPNGYSDKVLKLRTQYSNMLKGIEM